MAEAAGKEKEVFVKHGLLPDFIEQLESRAAAVGELLKRGRKAVRLLNAILQPRLAKDPELLAAWRSAKRVPPATVSASSGDSAAEVPSQAA